MPISRRLKVGIAAAGTFFLTGFAGMGSVTAQPIEPRRSSAESEFPFVVYGRPASTLVEGDGGYTQSIRKYPDANACLLETERTKTRPDLTKVNWSSMRLPKDVEVCVFRILTSIGDVEVGRRWFESQGFQLSPARHEKPAHRDEQASYSASIDKRLFNNMVGNQLNIFQLKLIRGVSIGIELDKTANLKAVILSTTSE